MKANHATEYMKSVRVKLSRVNLWGRGISLWSLHYRVYVYDAPCFIPIDHCYEFNCTKKRREYPSSSRCFSWKIGFEWSKIIISFTQMPEAHLYDYQGIMGQLVGYSQGGPIMVVWYFQISLGLIYSLTQITDTCCKDRAVGKKTRSGKLLSWKVLAEVGKFLVTL